MIHLAVTHARMIHRVMVHRAMIHVRVIDRSGILRCAAVFGHGMAHRAMTGRFGLAFGLRRRGMVPHMRRMVGMGLREARSGRAGQNERGEIYGAAHPSAPIVAPG